MTILAMTPTTPPTIEPTGVTLVLDDSEVEGGLDDVEVEGGLDNVKVEGGMLREVTTPKLDSPAEGETRK
jgi:hypothetical protein